MSLPRMPGVDERAVHVHTAAGQQLGPLSRRALSEAVSVGDVADTDIPRIIEMMVGRTLNEMFPKTEHQIGETLLTVRGVDGAPLARASDI